VIEQDLFAGLYDPASFTAYDYEAQVWRTGAPAVAVHVGNLEKELQILKGPHAAQFVRCGARDKEIKTVADAVAHVEAELAQWRKAMQ
jgi:hypothetical protein